MNNIIKFVLVFACIFVGALAQTELPMLKSRSAMLAYAVSQARQANGFLYSDSIANGGYDGKSWSVQKSALDILEQVKALKIKAETVDPKSNVYLYVSVSNQDGDTLFYGYNESKLVQVKGGWALPDSASNIELVMTLQPIKFEKSVSSAVMISKDSNGGTQYSQLNAYGNRVWFSPDSAGLKDAYVRISYTDGTTASFSTATGQLLTSYTLEAVITPAFKDLYPYKNPTTTVVLTVKSENSKGIVPTFEITSENSGRNVTFDVVTSDGKRPIKFWLVSQNGINLGWLSGNVSTTVVPVPQGVTYVIPEWNPPDFSETTQPVSTGGNGKG